MTCGEFRVDVDMIGTVQIEDAVGPAFAYQARMMRGNLGMREDDLVVGFSPDGDFSAGQFDGLHRREHILLSAGPITVGERDEGAIFIAYAEDITVRQGLVELLIAADFTTLVQKAIERPLPLIGRVRVDEDKLIALT